MVCHPGSRAGDPQAGRWDLLPRCWAAQRLHHQHHQHPHHGAGPGETPADQPGLPQRHQRRAGPSAGHHQTDYLPQGGYYYLFIIICLFLTIFYCIF